MNNTTTNIYQVNDSFFHKIFDRPENARDFLERVLPDGLKKMLDESKIDGGKIMPTLAQQMKEEFMQTLGSQLKDEGMEEKAIETAKKMLMKGFKTDIIMELTGLEKEEVEKLASIPR